jgi:hypothetical protein
MIVAGVLLTACGGGPGGGPSDGEFVKACLQEGQSTASKMLDTELGVTRDVFCACGEPIARASLSPDGYRAMVLEMGGKGEEAREITSKMSESEQTAALEVLGKMMEQCGAK